MNEQQRKRLVLALIIAIPIGGYVLFSSRGAFSRIGLEWEKRQLEATIQTMKHQQDSLKQVVTQLQTDTLAIEKLARERYGMVKPGEQVFLIEQRPTRQ